MTYYTFRPLDPYSHFFEVAKWNDHDIRPHTIYKVDTRNGRCNCPYPGRDCKHVHCVEEIIELGTQHQMYRWKWDENNQWTRLNDIVPIEELVHGSN